MPEITTIARPYAKATFELALEKITLKEWSQVLRILAMIVTDKTMQAVLSNPQLSKKEIATMLINVAGLNRNEDAKQLITLLGQTKRLNLLPAIAKLFEAFVAEHEKTIEVKVVSAYPIDKIRLQRLAHALQNNLKRQVSIRCAVDNALLGGIVIYAGDQVIDGSLRSKLKRLSERLCS